MSLTKFKSIFPKKSKTSVKKQEKALRAKAATAPYPTHLYSLGYTGTPREPMTWFVCNNEHWELGNPWAKPDDCSRCSMDITFASLRNRYLEEKGDPLAFMPEEFTSWEVADAVESYAATRYAMSPENPGYEDRMNRSLAGN